MRRQPGVLVLRFDFRPLAAALDSLAASFQKVGAAVQRMLKSARPAPIIGPHAIVPNFDLACSVCGRGPEEH